MSFICLRRKKETVADAIQMVGKVVEYRTITFPPGSAHKQTYDALYGTARAYFIQRKSFKLLSLYVMPSNRFSYPLSSSSVLSSERNTQYIMQNFMELLALVLRIRQSCNHMSLVPEDYRKRASSVNVEKLVAALDSNEGASLLEHLQGFFKQDMVECAVCMSEMNESDAKILRTCQHIFCGACLQHITNQLCPLCRAPYSREDMVDKKTAEKATKNPAAPLNAKKEIQIHGRSPKIQAVLDAIDQMKPDEKGVIFSQWTSVLDILQAEFEAQGHTFTRLGKSERT
jgi:SWI/SNF-related matrix-associated actin-dependent regulator of chromatin subfamily A3